MRINIEELKLHAIHCLPQLVQNHWPEAQKTTKGWRVGDLNGNKGQSLFLDAKSGAFFDHATDQKGGIFELAAYWGNATRFPETIEWLANQTKYELPKLPERKQTQPSKKLGKELGPKASQWLKGRGFSEDFLKKLPIVSTVYDNGAPAHDIAVVHNSEDGSQCHLIKYLNLVTRKWSSSTNPSHVLWPMDFVTKEFIKECDLLVITEGHWDAIAYLQQGIPACSIPSGVKNDAWIEECYDFIASFDTIALSYDTDEIGREGVWRVASRIASLVNPPLIITHSEGCKDANDELLNNGPQALVANLEKAEPYTPPEIIPAVSLIADAVESEKDNPFEYSTPFRNFAFHFRQHESSIFSGYTGHGKTSLVEQCVTYLADKYGIKTAIASFEDQPKKTVARLLRHRFGRAGVEDTPEARELLSHFHIWNTKSAKKGDNDPRRILDRFEFLHNRWGVDHFVIDNLATLSTSREDYNAIVDVTEEFRHFVNQIPGHTSIVAHPRKPGTQGDKGAPPNIFDVKGPSEIVDLAFNQISVSRNIEKGRQIQLMEDMGPVDRTRITLYDHQTPDATIIVGKQRATGELPMKKLWYDADRKILVDHPNERNIK